MWGKRRETQSETSPHADVQKFFSSSPPAPAEQVAAPVGAETVPEASEVQAIPAAGLNGAAAHPKTAADSILPPPERAAPPLRANPVSTAFGDMVALLAKSPAHKHLSLADLEWLLLPPVALGQFALADTVLPDGKMTLTGFALWARVSAEVDARLSTAPRHPLQLHPNEWQSGHFYWIVDCVGGPKAVLHCVETLAKTMFHGKQFRMLRVEIARSERNES